MFQKIKRLAEAVVPGFADEEVCKVMAKKVLADIGDAASSHAVALEERSAAQLLSKKKQRGGAGIVIGKGAELVSGRSKARKTSRRPMRCRVCRPACAFGRTIARIVG